MKPAGQREVPDSLIDAYHAALEQQGLRVDHNQEIIVARFAELTRALNRAGPVKRNAWHRFRARRDVRGLYLWGGVGAGKTFLTDLFFARLPFRDKQRLHFHRFMRHVHTGLKNHQERDPLKHVAAQFATSARVLCFDEFHVSDIGDAMILGGLLQALFEEGVTVVATSNIQPDALYRDGLQRARFVPAITAIKTHMEIIKLETGVDYRLRALKQAEMYHWPLDVDGDARLTRAFEQLALMDQSSDEPLLINDRSLPVVRRGPGVAWFRFIDLCEGPRSAADYIELSYEHHSILLAGVPAMDEERNNAARRFIALVDECYERNVKLIITAAVPVERLYCGKRLAGEFERTKSRLIEMQSQQYLARAHLAQ